MARSANHRPKAANGPGVTASASASKGKAIAAKSKPSASSLVVVLKVKAKVDSNRPYAAALTAASQAKACTDWNRRLLASMRNGPTTTANEPALPRKKSITKRASKTALDIISENFDYGVYAPGKPPGYVEPSQGFIPIPELAPEPEGRRASVNDSRPRAKKVNTSRVTYLGEPDNQSSLGYGSLANHGANSSKWTYLGEPDAQSSLGYGSLANHTANSSSWTYLGEPDAQSSSGYGSLANHAANSSSWTYLGEPDPPSSSDYGSLANHGANTIASSDGNANIETATEVVDPANLASNSTLASKNIAHGTDQPLLDHSFDDMFNEWVSDSSEPEDMVHDMTTAKTRAINLQAKGSKCSKGTKIHTNSNKETNIPAVTGPVAPVNSTVLSHQAPVSHDAISYNAKGTVALSSIIDPMAAMMIQSKRTGAEALSSISIPPHRTRVANKALKHAAPNSNADAMTKAMNDFAFRTELLSLGLKGTYPIVHVSSTPSAKDYATADRAAKQTVSEIDEEPSALATPHTLMSPTTVEEPASDQQSTLAFEKAFEEPLGLAGAASADFGVDHSGFPLPDDESAELWAAIQAADEADGANTTALSESDRAHNDEVASITPPHTLANTSNWTATYLTTSNSTNSSSEIMRSTISDSVLGAPGPNAGSQSASGQAQDDNILPNEDTLTGTTEFVLVEKGDIQKLAQKLTEIGAHLNNAAAAVNDAAALMNKIAMGPTVSFNGQGRTQIAGIPADMFRGSSLAQQGTLAESVLHAGIDFDLGPEDVPADGTTPQGQGKRARQETDGGKDEAGSTVGGQVTKAKRVKRMGTDHNPAKPSDYGFELLVHHQAITKGDYLRVPLSAYKDGAGTKQNGGGTHLLFEYKGAEVGNKRVTKWKVHCPALGNEWDGHVENVTCKGGVRAFLKEMKDRKMSGPKGNVFSNEVHLMHGGTDLGSITYIKAGILAKDNSEYQGPQP